MWLKPKAQFVIQLRKSKCHRPKEFFVTILNNSNVARPIEHILSKPKNLIGTRLRNLNGNSNGNFDKTEKFQLWQNSNCYKTLIMTKLKNSMHKVKNANCYKTQK